MLEEPTRALESQREDVLVRWTPDRLLEGAHEIRRTQLGLARQLLDRDTAIETGIDELEDARPRCRRQSSACSRSAGRVHASVMGDLQAQAGDQRFHEWQPARVGAIGFGDERPYEMLHLRCLDTVDAAELDMRAPSSRIIADADQTHEMARIDRDGRESATVRRRGARTLSPTGQNQMLPGSSVTRRKPCARYTSRSSGAVSVFIAR